MAYFAFTLQLKTEKSTIMRYCSAILLTIVAAAAAGCTGADSGSSAPVRVKVAIPAQVAMTGAREYSGTIEENAGTMLSFAAAGTVRSVNVVPGQRVAKGELIATLDETSVRHAHDMALAALEQAEDAYARMKQLHDDNSLPDIQWVEVQSRLKQARASAELTAKNLADTHLYVPFSGVIASKEVEAGQNVLPGVPVARLVDVSSVKVCVAVPEGEISSISSGDPVDVKVAALGGRAYSGRVVEKGVAASPLSRTYSVKASVPNPDGQLLPGMICTAVMACGDAGGSALVLPARVVQTDCDNRTFVWTNRDGHARKAYVVTGALVREGVVIEAGISAADEVISDGAPKVSDGTEIEVVR